MPPSTQYNLPSWLSAISFKISILQGEKMLKASGDGALHKAAYATLRETVLKELQIQQLKW